MTETVIYQLSVEECREIGLASPHGYSLPLQRTEQGYDVTDLAYASRRSVEKAVRHIKQREDIVMPISFWQYTI